MWQKYGSPIQSHDQEMAYPSYLFTHSLSPCVSLNSGSFTVGVQVSFQQICSITPLFTGHSNLVNTPGKGGKLTFAYNISITKAQCLFNLFSIQSRAFKSLWGYCYCFHVTFCAKLHPKISWQYRWKIPPSALILNNPDLHQTSFFLWLCFTSPQV